jgi:hypothetical protein
VPKVPQYEPQVQERPVGTPYSNVHYAPEDFGSAIGQGARRASGELEQAAAIQRAEAEKARKFRSDDAYLKFAQGATDIMWDSKTGYMNQRGEAALDHDGVVGSLRKLQREIFQELPDDETKQLYLTKSTGHLEQARESINRHAAQQTDEVYKTVADGQAKLALDTIGLNYSDPKAVDSAMGKVLFDPDGGAGPLPRYLKDVLHLPDAAIEAQVADFKAKGYGAALKGYLAASDGTGAKAYFEQVKGQLGSEAATLERDVHHLFAATQAGRDASEIASSSKLKGYEWIDPDAARAKLETIPEGPRREAARKVLDDQLQDAAASKKRGGENVFEQALSLYWQNGNNLHDPKMSGFASYLLDPNNGAVELWNRLQREDELARSRSREATARVNTDALKDFMARPSDERAHLNIDTVYGGSTTKPMRDQMRAEQNKLVEQMRKAGGLQTSEFDKSLETAINKAPDLKSSKGNQRDFKAYMNRWYLQYTSKSNGVPPTLEEVETQKAQAFRETVREGTFFDSKVPAYRIRPGDKVKGAAGVVPVEERALIESALRAKGRAVTDEEVQRLYDLKHQGTK